MKVEKERKYLKITKANGVEVLYDYETGEIDVKKLRGVGIEDILKSIEDEKVGRYFLCVDMLTNSKRGKVRGLVVGERSYKEELKDWLESDVRKKERGNKIEFFENIRKHRELERYVNVGYEIRLDMYNRVLLKEQGCLTDNLLKRLVEVLRYCRQEIECREEIKKELESTYKVGVLSKLEWLKYFERELVLRGSIGVSKLEKRQREKMYKELERLKKEGDVLGIYILIESICEDINRVGSLLEMLNGDIKKYIEGVKYYVDIEGISRLDTLVTLWLDTLSMMREVGYRDSKVPKYLKSKHDEVMRRYNEKRIEYDAKRYKEIYESKKGMYEYKGKEFEVKMFPTVDSIKEEGRVLNHCVISYINKVLKEKVVLLGLREEEGKPQITLEVSVEKPLRVIQAKGSCNRCLTKRELEMLEEYKREKGIV